jgi:hypothetical protein
MIVNQRLVDAGSRAISRVVPRRIHSRTARRRLPVFFLGLILIETLPDNRKNLPVAQSILYRSIKTVSSDLWHSRKGVKGGLTFTF